MIRFWEKVSKILAKLETEILVEQELHAEAVTNRLSRSAA